MKVRLGPRTSFLSNTYSYNGVGLFKKIAVARRIIKVIVGVAPAGAPGRTNLPQIGSQELGIIQGFTDRRGAVLEQSGNKQPSC
jgi:hypothetical protein